MSERPSEPLPVEEPLSVDTVVEIDPPERRFPRRHRFRAEDIEALEIARDVGRPLLIRGESGCGKSQLALAAAIASQRAFVSEVIDARTEARDLLWRFDAVRRLADAQVGRESLLEERQKAENGAADDPWHESYYTAPGVLWWAFAWSDAEAQARTARIPPQSYDERCDPGNGVVVLLDEIDKADGSLPNGLLGALGDWEFRVPGLDKRVVCEGVEPLVVVTTNEERSLPDAFQRRCIVLNMDPPPGEEAFLSWLVERGSVQFGPDTAWQLEPGILHYAAKLVFAAREKFKTRGLAPPGGAEYLDLLRVLVSRPEREETPEELLQKIAVYILDKHPAEKKI